MKTKRGIYNDLDESKYIYSLGSLTFYFSSKFYMEKFKNEYKEYVKSEKIKIQLKYKCTLNGDEMILLNLYKSIEKRGFKVYYNNCELNKDYTFKTIINEM